MAVYGSGPPLGDHGPPDHRLILSDRWLARTTGVLYSSGAITAFVWTLLADRAEPGLGTVNVMASIALVLGLGMAFGAADKAPRVFFHLVIIAIQLVISVGFAATQSPTSSTALFYVWTTTYAWLLFGRSAAVVQTVWTGICLAGALWVMDAGLLTGVRVWVMVMSTAVTLALLVGVVADRMRRGQARLSYAASHDPLSGLTNRAYFAHAVESANRRCGAADEVVYVLLIAVDHFKLVNDSYGHGTGDEVLRVLASRLTAAAGPLDVVARVGGDEFAIVCCANPDGDRGPVALLDRLAGVWAEPIALGSGLITVSATTGVAAADQVGGHSELLRWADVALYHAKRTERGSVVFFDKPLSVLVSRRSELGQAMQRAVARGEFSVHYQPIVDLQDRRILGAEALLRWQAGSLGEILPEEFIPVAEETGLIVPIGEWVLDEVAAQLAQWRRDGAVNDDFRLAVNLSVRQLAAGFAERVLHTLAEHDLPRQMIALEITESVLLDDSRRFGQVLADLHQS